jgi:hypothetical protein
MSTVDAAKEQGGDSEVPPGFGERCRSARKPLEQPEAPPSVWETSG